MEKKIAVYGGAFDPLTVAHEAIIQYLLENYSEVHIHVTDNDEKKYNVPFEDRRAMILARFPKIIVHRQTMRTYDTLQCYYGEYPQAMYGNREIDLILGLDEIESLLAGEWKDSDKILAKYNIRVFNRGREFNFHIKFAGHDNIKPIFVNVPDVSSTAVREEMFMNPMYEGTAVSSQVLGYIFAHNLYHQDNPFVHSVSELDALSKYKPGDYPKPSVTVTSVVISAIGDPSIGREDMVLLVRRKRWPFANYWCLPGGFTNPHEPIETCSCRELKEETGLVIAPNQVHQLKVYIPVDPRESVPGHWAYDVGVYTRGIFGQVKGDDDAAEAGWFPLSVAPKTHLAFQHNQILEDYVKAIGR